MLKYAKITDEQTGLCEVGIGTNSKFYKSIGMTEQDVCQSSVDGNWYLSEKCPQKTYEQLLLEEKNKKHEENTRLTKLAVENGNVVFKGAEFETNAQTVGDLTATMLLMQAQQTLKQIQSDTTNDAAVSSSSANISETDNLSGQAQQAVILSDSEVSDTDYVTQDSSGAVVLDFRAVDFLDFTFRLCLCRFVENLLLTSSLAFARLHSTKNPLSWILFQHLITCVFNKILYKQILRALPSK